MKRLILLLTLFGLTTFSYAGPRPNGKLTDGAALTIENSGFSITPEAGMKTVLARMSEPPNYRFPWLRGKRGLVEFAFVPHKYAKMPIQEGFDAFVADKNWGGKFYTGRSEALTTQNGIKVIRAEFQVERGFFMVRYFMTNSDGELCYVHIVPVPAESKDLETMVLETLKNTQAPDRR